jgi:hypothetical protein
MSNVRKLEDKLYAPSNQDSVKVTDAEIKGDGRKIRFYRR